MLLGVHCTAPSWPRDTSCHTRDVAGARDLLSFRGAQRVENKFEMEVSCRYLNSDDLVFFYLSHSNFLLAAKEPRRELVDAVMKCWPEYLEEIFGDVGHFLNPSSQIILDSGCDKDYKRRRGSHVNNAASSEVGDLHGQAVPQRFFPAAEDKMKLM